MAIHLRLTEWMEKRGLTVQELSRRTGVSRVNLSRLRSGHSDGIRFATLDALCSALGCKPGELLEHVSDIAESSHAEITPDMAAVLDALKDGQANAAMLCEQVKRPVPAVLGAITLLELEGLIVREPAGFRRV